MPLTADLTKFKLAPAAAFFNGAYIGEVSYDNPIMITDDVRGVDMRSARLGKVDMALLDHDCFVTVPVVEVAPENLAMAIPGSDASGGVVTVSYKPGTKIRQFAQELVVKRLVDGDVSTDPDDIFTFPFASPAPGTITQNFSATRQQEFAIKFQVWPDLTTGALYTVGG